MRFPVFIFKSFWDSVNIGFSLAQPMSVASGSVAGLGKQAVKGLLVLSIQGGQVLVLDHHWDQFVSVRGKKFSV